MISKNGIVGHIGDIVVVERNGYNLLGTMLDFLEHGKSIRVMFMGVWRDVDEINIKYKLPKLDYLYIDDILWKVVGYVKYYIKVSRENGSIKRDIRIDYVVNFGIIVELDN